MRAKMRSNCEALDRTDVIILSQAKLRAIGGAPEGSAHSVVGPNARMSGNIVSWEGMKIFTPL